MAWRLNRGIGQPVNLTTNQAKEAEFITRHVRVLVALSTRRRVRSVRGRLGRVIPSFWSNPAVRSHTHHGRFARTWPRCHPSPRQGFVGSVRLALCIENGRPGQTRASARAGSVKVGDAAERRLIPLRGSGQPSGACSKTARSTPARAGSSSAAMPPTGAMISLGVPRKSWTVKSSTAKGGTTASG